MNGEAGKGDAYRPVNRKAYEEGYDRIYGRKQGPHICPVCGGVTSYDPAHIAAGGHDCIPNCPAKSYDT